METFEVTFISLDEHTHKVLVNAFTRLGAEMEFDSCYQYKDIVSIKQLTDVDTSNE